MSRLPLGVVCCISPWNLPLYLFTWKIAPALVVGNTVVAKPSEITPYTAYLLGDVCSKVGLPTGVLNIVHGRGTTTGDLLVKNESIKAISFTGGTATGRLISKNASDSFKKLSLELGGKNPNVVFVRPSNLWPHMKRISLKKIYDAIRFNQHEIVVEENIINKARLAIDRMLEIGRK